MAADGGAGAAWQGLLGLVRWRWVAMRNAPWLGLQLLLHARHRTLRAESAKPSKEEATPGQTLTAYAVRASDHLLLELMADRTGIGAPGLFARAERADDKALFKQLSERAWRVAIGGAVFELRHRVSGFRLTADGYQSHYKELLRAAGTRALKDTLLRERRIVRAARVLLLSMLDADAVHSLRRAGEEVNATNYNWLIIERAKRCWREQAVQA